MDNSLYQSREYKRSRNAYIWECAFEYFIALTVSDAFLANLLSTMGFDDRSVGIISSLITFAFLFQLAAVLVAQRIRNVKLISVTVHSISQLFFIGLYLIPFIPVNREVKLILVILCTLIAYFGNYLVTSVIFRWGNSYVDPVKRGHFAATKETISLVTGVAFTLGMGYMVDRFAEQDNVYGGFIFTAIVMLVVAIMDFVCLCLMKNREPAPVEMKESVPFGKILKSIFASRGFRSVVIAYVLWTVANYTISGFMGTYKTKDLLLTVGTVQLINIVGCLARALVSRPFGLYTDKHSYSAGLKLGLAIVTLSFVANIFTTPSLWWMVIVHTLLHNVAMAGISQNFNNIMFSYVEENYYVEATAIKNSIGGLCGFLASLLAGGLLSVIQENGNMLFGMPLYAQQVLSAIAAVIAVCSILYIHFVLQKQKVVGR